MQMEQQNIGLQEKLEILNSTEETKQALEDCLADFHEEFGRFPTPDEMEAIANQLLYEAAVALDPTLAMDDIDLKLHRLENFGRKYKKWIIAALIILACFLSYLHDTYVNCDISPYNTRGAPRFLFP